MTLLSGDAVLAELAALVARQKGSAGSGDVMSRAIRAHKQCGGNSGKLTTSLGNQSNTGVSFQLREIPADVYTVKVSVLDLPPYNGVTNPYTVSTLVTIIFGANGQQTVRQATVGQGVSVSGQCDFVNVLVTDNSPAPFSGPVQPFQYQVSITVAPGLRADVFGPPTLAPYDANGFLIPPDRFVLANGGGRIDVQVPPNVGVNSLLVTAGSGFGGIAAGDISVSQQSQGGTALAFYDPIVYTGWVPLLTGVQQIEIVNAHFAHDAITSLTFGIDG